MAAGVQDVRRYREAYRVTMAGTVVDVVLAAVKILFGIIGRSQALLADGVHSLSDLVSDALVLFAAKHGSRSADEDHPYGHARIETAATVALGLLLLAVAVGIGIDAVYRMFNPSLLLRPEPITLGIAAFSIVSKEGLYWYTLHVAREIRSNVLRANAWHHRSDAVSSVVVLVGLAGTLAGLPYLDAVAAALVAVMIAKIGWDLGWNSMRELVDTALEKDRVEAIRQTILSVGGVEALHMLRTRRMGGNALVDVHILVDPRLSVSEGHQISEAVRAKLIKGFDEVSDVMVHIDPEDDERGPTPCCTLPLRNDLLRRLREQWGSIAAADRIENVTLHYLDGKVQVELTLPLSVAQDMEHVRRLADELVRASKAVNEVGAVRVYFH